MTDAPTPWAEPSDVIDSWIGPDAPSDENLVAIWIAKAEREIRRPYPDMQARIDSTEEPDLAENVKDVIVAMVTRVLRNPEMKRQLNETTGPFSEGYTVGGPLGLTMTGAELDKLGTAATGGKAFEVDPLSDYVAPSWALGGHGLWRPL